MKVVLDTNILVSGTFWKGDSAKILECIDIKKIELILSEELIKEYNEIIKRDEILDKIDGACKDEFLYGKTNATAAPTGPEEAK